MPLAFEGVVMLVAMEVKREEKRIFAEAKMNMVMFMTYSNTHTYHTNNHMCRCVVRVYDGYA